MTIIALNKRGHAKQFFPGVFCISKKGQVSIEFILLIVIALVYIYGTVGPLINDATTAAEDVQRVSDTKISAQKLANAINEAAAGSGESKRTIHLIVPAKATVKCDSAKITFVVDISKLQSRLAPSTVCVEKTDSDGKAYFECTSSLDLLATPTCTPNEMQGPLFKAVIVTNSAGVITIG